MNALRKMHAALVPGGLLFDFHPTAPDSQVVCGNRMLGERDDSRFLETVRTAEASLNEALTLGLFELEKAVKYVVVDRFDSAEELLARATTAAGSRVPAALAPKIRAAADPPFEIHHNVALRKLRAL